MGLALVFGFGRHAGAMYMDDGTAPNGSLTNSTNAGWNLPQDGICVLGLSTSGVMPVATTTTAGIPSLTTKRDCDYYNYGLTGMNAIRTTTYNSAGTPANVTATYGTYGTCTAAGNKWDNVNGQCWQANGCSGTSTATNGTLEFNTADHLCYDTAPCTVAGTTGNDGYQHAISTSICVDSNGNGITLKDLDRTFAMCQAKGGTWKTISDTVVATGSGSTATPGVQAYATPGFGGACVAYSWQFRGVDAQDNSLPFGSNGTTFSSTAPATGFCYTNMNTTLGKSGCPTVAGSTSGTANSTSEAAFGYAVSGSTCTYAYGISGPVNAALKSPTGAILTATGASIDLSQYSTLGTCLAAGGTWSNWLPYQNAAVSTGGLAKAELFTLNTLAPSTTNGCLHCHSTTVQYNGPVNRYKDSYVTTGHKNMLRKVIPGQAWYGPNAEGGLSMYTADSSGNALSFNATNPTDGSNTVYYLIDGWFTESVNAASGTIEVNPSAEVAGSAYSCSNCHSTGFSGSPTSSTTAQPGVQSIGTPGYLGAQPAASGAGYVSAVKAGYTWDYEGIRCGRCHNATIPQVTQNQIYGGACGIGATACSYEGGTWTGTSCTAPSTGFTQSGCNNLALLPGVSAVWVAPTASCSVSFANIQTSSACTAAGGVWTANTSGSPSAFLATAPTGTGMGALAAGTGRTNLCVGCHQAVASAWPAQSSVVPAAATTTTGVAQWDPTWFAATATGTIPAAVPTRDFSGHFVGMAFLNSPHARYTGAQSGKGSLTPNSLGEKDLTDPNGTVEYNSLFKGYKCFQSPTSTSEGTTLGVSGGTVTEITTKAECDALYTPAADLAAGFSSWRADDGAIADGTQGTCVTCHDVHNSLFVANEHTKSIRRTCQDCHQNNATTSATDANAPRITSINHPTTAGTPFDTNLYPDGPCVVCHMAAQAQLNGDQNSFLPHIWRINTSSTYSTFPSINQWNGINGARMDHNVQTAPEKYWGGTYQNAAWVDLDLACGQCHGGGSSAVTTMGSITAGSKTLTVSSSSGITPGCRISVTGAGPNASLPNLMTIVVSVSGNTVTVNKAAVTTVSNAEVRLNATVNNAPYKNKAALSQSAMGMHPMN